MLPVPRARHQAFRYNGGDEDHIVKLEDAVMDLDKDCLLPVGLKIMRFAFDVIGGWGKRQRGEQ
ncbi:hypothetical protein BT96DRAFT_996161 [Gymnopus androsaceus JB14]|uniref:Uncharacterized protein n=1 Tax=Gymnopus androsaceus JB14 TaxID=1447944 RepID=A0A6A4HF33_9AGAR|nr:hypothetical protein BT96DRAFT_996161 [Gymnopus androsaceus JB14]